MRFIRLETWKEKDMLVLVKELYEKKGYRVKGVHGRLEAGIDLLAEKLDSAGNEVIEKLGIQVTIPKANKSYIQKATFALNYQGLNLSYFLIISIRGYTEDFVFNLDQIGFKDKIISMNGNDLEKDLFAHGIVPEQELQRLEEEFYKSQAFVDLNDITKSIYEKGYLSKLELESALKSVHENKAMIAENLRLLMRGLQAVSSVSGNIWLAMNNAISKNHLEEFLNQFLKGQGLILKPLEKMKNAIRNLKSIPAVMKLFFGSLSGTERGSFIRRKGDVTGDLWIFTYFDPEYIVKYGQRVVLIQIFNGLHNRSNEIKYRVEKVLEILEKGENEIRENLGYFISSFPRSKTNPSWKKLS